MGIFGGGWSFPFFDLCYDPCWQFFAFAAVAFAAVAIAAVAFAAVAFAAGLSIVSLRPAGRFKPTVGFELTSLRNATCTPRLRPLGQPVT